MHFLLSRRVAIFLCVATTLSAAVARLEIAERSPILDGKPFGASGAYERVRGRVHFTVDPKHPANHDIVDLALAPRDPEGLVHFSADLYVLRPVDLRKGNKTILFEVVNRGSKGALATFNRAENSTDPSSPVHFGDGLLMNAGYMIVWLGWQHDVPVTPGKMRIELPVAKGVTGRVRGEFTPDRPVDMLPLGDASHIPYPPIDTATMRLTVRDGVHGRRLNVDASQWSLENGEAIRLKTPAQPGRIYEFIYKSANPAIAGLGFAAIRDLISYYKQQGEAEYAIGFGVSQSAMVLRALVYEGFNADEAGKRVFDGIFAHVAGGRRTILHRFAQPSRTAGPLRNSSLSSTDQFPFSDIEQADPYTKRRDGVLKRAVASKVIPLIFNTNSTYEYWGSGGSLIHTTPDGTRDIDLPATTRLYVFAGGQHGPASLPPQQGRGQNLPNFNDYRWSLRALLPSLQAWIQSSTLPRDSVYPTLREKTLTPIEGYQFPPVAGVKLPASMHVPSALRPGATEPPEVIGSYRALVPQSDADGNELGGVQMPEVACSLGTWTGWNLRSANMGATNTLLSNTGSYLPFPRSREEGKQTGDLRRSVEERFSSAQDYERCVEREAKRLSDRGFLLSSDIPRLISAAKRHWQWRMTTGIHESASR